MQGCTDGLQSGDDSGLTNLWDEYCVQVQLQDSVLRSLYDEMIEAFIHESIGRLPFPQLTCLWLQTYQGADWTLSEPDDRAADPVSADEVVAYLRSAVEATAADWSNRKIRNYFNRSVLE